MHMILVKGTEDNKTYVNKNYDRQKLIFDEVNKVWKEILPKLEKAYPEFNELHGFNVSFNNRLRTTGGRVFLDKENGTVRMELNEKLLSTNVDIIRMVFIHEVAHLVQFAISGYSNHDWEFREIMKDLGCEPTTFMPKGLDRSLFKPRETKYHVYECDCGEVHKVKTYKHTKIQKGLVYTCKKSGSPLRPFKYQGDLIDYLTKQVTTELEKKMLEMKKNPNPNNFIGQ